MAKKRRKGRGTLSADALPTFVSVTWLGDEMDLNEKTLYERIRKGELPGVRRLGRRIRIHRPTLVAWFQRSGGVASSSPAPEQSRPGRVERPEDKRPSRKSDVPTVASFAQAFIRRAQGRDRPSEVASKEMICRVHLVPALGHLRVDRLDATTIRAYAAKKKKEGLAPASIRNHVICISGMLSAARERGLIRRVPRLRWPVVPAADIDVPDLKTATALATAAKGQWRAMVQIASKTGLRPGELRALRATDVNLRQGELSVRRSAWRQQVGTTKGGRPRVVPLSPKALQILRVHIKKRGPGRLVFPGMGGRMLTRDELKAPLRRACKEAGMHKFSWGSFRHMFATLLANRGVPLTAIQQLLGHRNLRTTSGYVHLPVARLRSAVARLDAQEKRGKSRRGARGRSRRSTRKRGPKPTRKR